jgi:hypothetical protein
MKKIVAIVVVALMGAVGYYFFVVPYEFEVRFSTKTLPGDVIETIRIWNRSLDQSKVENVVAFDQLSQQISWEGSTYRFLWKFEPIHDSLTKVIVRISEPQKRLTNKMLVPFGNPKIEVDAAKISKTFFDVLKTHLDITRVKIIGESSLDSTLCVCRSLKTDQVSKANGMMNEYSLLISFVDAHNLKVKDEPIVRIEEWDHENGTLAFDFCFQIHPVDVLPPAETVTFKKFPGTRALKAEYRGNYITSDRAWYALLRYAEMNGYKTSGKPIEYFHDNPNLGMNERNWKAEIYLPLTNDKEY